MSAHSIGLLGMLSLCRLYLCARQLPALTTHCRAPKLSMYMKTAPAACQDKAREVGTSLSVAPSLDEYVGGAGLELGLAGQHQRVNAALAVSLAAAWEAKYVQVCLLSPYSAWHCLYSSAAHSWVSMEGAFRPACHIAQDGSHQRH